MIRKTIPLLLCLLCLLGLCASASANDTTWDLSEADTEELEQRFLEALETPDLNTILLGSGDAAEDGRVPWEALAHLRAARPELQVDYSFTLCGCHFTLDDEVMDLRRRKMDDQGALVRRVTSCMPKLRTLDMDSCGVDDEHMAALRDALPQANVVWRIWFGERGGLAGYSVRTDVERILASNPGIGGELRPENTVPLKYCTRVKYLDLGHNSYLRSLDFLRYMPDLELLIVAMGDWYDLSPLENCQKLVYAELQTSAVSDLRPLTKLPNLKHLNFGWCFALHDITPLYDMPQLERLWIGCLTPVPEEQIETFKSLHPDCVVETEINDPTAAGWRYLGHTEWGETILDPTYQWVRDMMHYSDGSYAYAYPYNDPLSY